MRSNNRDENEIKDDRRPLGVVAFVSRAMGNAMSLRDQINIEEGRERRCVSFDVDWRALDEDEDEEEDDNLELIPSNEVRTGVERFVTARKPDAKKSE